MRKNPLADLARLARDVTRTPLFWLLYDRHAELSRAWAGHRVRWPVVAAWVAACGVTDKQGRAIQPGAVKMTWRRVCAARVEEEARAAAKAKPGAPRPAPAAAPPAARSSTAAPLPVRLSPAPLRPAEALPTESEVQERINAMRETIYRRSGRVWPPTDGG